MLCSLISKESYAACSDAAGKATINEVYKLTTGTGTASFIEIKIIDEVVTSAVYDEWTLQVCYEPSNNNLDCKSYNVSDFTDNFPWLYIQAPTFEDEYLDFKKGFDITLRGDATDNGGADSQEIIDYVVTEDFFEQDLDGCSVDDLPYWFGSLSTNNGTKLAKRITDGTGSWEIVNFNDESETPGANNDGPIDHFEIDAIDGQGLTCEADNITIRACANAACSILNTNATDVVLSINGSEHKTVTVIGSTEATFNYTTAGIATLSLDKTYECVNGNPNDCDVTFSDTGFRFFSNTEGTDIPTQLSGKPSDTGFNASTLKVQAIEKNPETGACQAVFIDATAIEMAATCVDPTSCAGSKVAINNLTTTANIDTLNDGETLTYEAVTLNFGDNTGSAAEFIFTYPDAGKMQLHARYNIPDENGDPSGNYMLGSSNNLVVRPFGFYIDVVGNPKAQTAGGDKFIAAGEEFTTTLKAVQWQAGDDDSSGEDNDGVPDTGADISDNAVTLNFGKEVDTETATITDTLYLPVPGTEGTLTSVDFTNFSDGVDTNTMTYSEVGIVRFTATTTSYLGASDITTIEPFVGRFIPHHFELTTGFDGELKSVCDLTSPSSEMGFAYAGQMSSEASVKGALQYELEPKLLVSAKSSICPDGVCSTTENYTGDFIKFSASNVEYIIPTEDAEKDGVLGVKVKLTANLTDGTLPEESSGVITYVFNANDNFIYLHEQNAEIAPFPAKIELGIDSVEDSDGVVAIDGDDDNDNGRLWVLTPEGIEIRFGRAYLENSFGPETSTLGQVLSIEHFDGTNFVLADEDTCSQYNSTNVRFGLLNEVSLDPDDIPLVSGTFIDIDDLADGVTRQIVLPAAGTDNQGEVEVIYSIYDWLKYDWAYDDEAIDGLYNDDPRAIATFGLFRGNDRIIYQREVH